DPRGWGRSARSRRGGRARGWWDEELAASRRLRWARSCRPRPDATYPCVVGLNAIDAARRAVSPIAVIATLPETVPELRSITRRAGMTGWEGELVRRAGDVSLDRAGTVLPWWPGHGVRRVLATGRSRPSSHSFVSEYEAMSVGVAERVLGRFAHVEALAADLEWLVDHCDPRSRPQLSDALRRPRPTSPAARSHVLALALH